LVAGAVPAFPVVPQSLIEEELTVKFGYEPVIVIGPAFVKVGAGTLILNVFPALETEAAADAVVVMTIVGVISGAVLIIEPEVMLIPAICISGSCC